MTGTGQNDDDTRSDETSSDPAAVAARLQSLLVSLDSVTDFLAELSALAAEILGPATSCGITVRHDNKPYTVASSDQRAAALDETQYTLSNGPCLQCLNSGEVLQIHDVAQETRWPDYVAASAERGLRCSLSLPIQIEDAVVGAMNLYGFDGPDMFSADIRQRCEVLAGQASGALRVVAGRHRDQELVGQLEHALTSRSVIDQALGILIGVERCSPAQAFTLLRMRSQSSQRKLRDVAADLILRTTGNPPDPGRPFDR